MQITLIVICMDFFYPPWVIRVLVNIRMTVDITRIISNTWCSYSSKIDWYNQRYRAHDGRWSLKAGSKLDRPNITLCYTNDTWDTAMAVQATNSVGQTDSYI